MIIEIGSIKNASIYFSIDFYGHINKILNKDKSQNGKIIYSDLNILAYIYNIVTF
jgi:hypothetical protein